MTLASNIMTPMNRWRRRETPPERVGYKRGKPSPAEAYMPTLENDAQPDPVQGC